MPYLLNLVYLCALGLFTPWLVYKACTTGKYRRGLWDKFFGVTPDVPADRPCVWFHGVSVGEVLLLRKVVAAFRQRYPQYQVVLSTTTDTGLAEARKHFADLPTFYWPLDFTWAVRGALRRVRPVAVVLAESELWPNFLLAAKRERVKVAVINGRLSPRSFRRYQKVRWLAAPLLRRVDLFAMQTEEYAANVRALGGQQIVATGSVKYDGVTTDRDNAKTQSLRGLFAVGPDDLVWIAGSTQAPEEEIALRIYNKLLPQFPNLRLILVPRQQARFTEVAELLRRSNVPFVRRSQMTVPPANPRAVLLVDSIGELGAVWGLADVAYVGGSLDGKRGGQNMLEPAAYGAAVTFGPHVWNFKQDVARLLERGAAVQIRDEAELGRRTAELLGDPALRARLGGAARAFVLSQQGATERTITILGELLAGGDHARQAA